MILYCFVCLAGFIYLLLLSQVLHYIYCSRNFSVFIDSVIHLFIFPVTPCEHKSNFQNFVNRLFFQLQIELFKTPLNLSIEKRD